ncbi:hypothetical protein F4861DRAFT_462262 [Xylaria intraflava]|nr:hypothetical protein F4861DRAFT_462262 [Xylaria intraflava]
MNNLQGANHGQGPEPWNLEVNDSGDEHDDDIQEENNLPVEDDASNYSEANDSESASDMTDEEDNPSSRRRARSSKSKSKKCSKCRDIKTRWENDVKGLNSAYSTRKKQYKDEITRLNMEIAKLKGGKVTTEPWTKSLKGLLVDIRSSPNVNANYSQRYGSIYSASCKQGNMSTKSSVCHPDLFLHSIVYNQAQIQKHFLDQMLKERFRGLELRGIHRSIRAIIFPQRCTRPIPLRLLENAPFRFESLPLDIQCRVWKQLIPNGELVHCLSRLDRLNPPLDCQLEGKVSFPSRFHIGNKPCCVAKADKPSRYLDYFLVSKRWYYTMAHLFYASNTFAFSSLGEFGRFCSGVGESRVARLVNIEIMWAGALMPKKKRGFSLRKEPLSWLMHTSCLRTLCVHINESARSYMRRRYEMMLESDGPEDFADSDIEDMRSDILKYVQCNSWKNRSLRTVQGMDFIYQLRGMRWVRFYDTNAERSRTLICDSSFLLDVHNQVTMPKSNLLARKTHIDNLRPFTGLQGFSPDAETAELVRSFYGDIPVEDAYPRSTETPSSDQSMTSDNSAYPGPGDDSGYFSRNLLYGNNMAYMDRDMDMIDIDDEKPPVTVIKEDEDGAVVNATPDLGGSGDSVPIASDPSNFDSDSDSGCDSSGPTKRRRSGKDGSA